MSADVPDVEGFTLLDGEEVRHNIQPSFASYMTDGQSILLAIISLGILPFLFVKGSRYVVTNERVMKKTGLLGTSTEEYRIDDISQLSTGQRLVEKLLGVGNLQFATAAAGSNIVFFGLDDHESVANTIRNVQRE
ncbi:MULTISPECIES: PH domain-containing protein [Haloferax]|uniref:PH domain-containing protein n=1 Tax=Haloferax marinum TaxID=2666143 RepID=A0A6A8G6R4_9EURY|nr:MULTISPECIES: PH domain-containing protein [Haloferax]KAB1196944.1 PH domain-containing protein [Haloferax sp. CBA1150]MRW95963.1 PH domain-containing protein [Haloferax marinum]